MSRICDGSIGRNDRNSDAPAALNMLPKLLDVPISTYLIVFAKIAPPLDDAVREHVEVLLEQDDVGGVLRDVRGRVDRDADVGSVQRHRVVHAVTEERDAAASAASPHERALCSGPTRANTVVPGIAAVSASSSSPSISTPVSVAPAGRPELGAHPLGDHALSPVMTFTSMPRSASRARAGRHSPWRVEEHEEPLQSQGYAVHTRNCGDGRVGLGACDRDHAVARREFAVDW